MGGTGEPLFGEKRMNETANDAPFPRRAFRAPSGHAVAIELDGERIEAVEGETLLAALMAARGWVLRCTDQRGAPRGMFCGMGACMDCLVHLAGEGLVRACATFVRAGMVCRTPRPAENVGCPIDPPDAPEGPAFITGERP